MPCLQPHTVRNPRYGSSELRPYPEPPEDARLLYIDVPCGRCVECRKRRANDWRFRLHQEYKYSKTRNFHFITLTYDREKYSQLAEKYGLTDDNEIVKKSVRLFLERYRKVYKKSLRHFFVTDIGEEDEHIHLHGIIIDCKAVTYKRGKNYADFVKLSKLWEYGFIWLGWCNEKSISYILKYVMKTDPRRPDYRPIILTSPGMGRDYCKDDGIIQWHTTPKDGIFYAVTTSGHKIALPRYYQLKFFNDEFRLARQIRLLDDPPPLMFKGRQVTMDEYYNLSELVLRSSVNSKVSQMVKRIDMRPTIYGLINVTGTEFDF